MKRLTCEMCGSTDLVKEDGVFVCQSCGCKYSVEEAKKMMVEGTVEVSGTVKVDASPQVESFEKNIARLASEGKDDEGYRECQAILRLDYSNPWGKAFQALFSNSLKAETKDYSSYASEVAEAFKEMARRGKSADEYLDFAIACAKKSGSIEYARKSWARKEQIETKNFLIANAMYLPCASKTALDIKLERIELEHRQRAADDIMKDGSVQTIRVICAAVDNIADWSGASANKVEMLQGRLALCSTDRSIVGSKKTAAFKTLDGVVRKNRAAYWDEHPEEKAKLEDELAKAKEAEKRDRAEVKSLQSQLDELTARKESVLPVEAERNKLEDEVASQLHELSSLGFFKSKEKKALNEKIEAGKERLADFRKRADRERSELLAELDPKIEDLGKQISAKTSSARSHYRNAVDIEQKLGI